MSKLLWLPLAVYLMLGDARNVSADKESASAIVDKAIQAHGGAKHLAKLRQVQSTGKGVLHDKKDIPLTIAITLVLPDKVRTETTLEGGGLKVAVTRVFNGGKGWVNINKKTKEMVGKDLEEAREGMQAALVTSVLPLREKSNRLAPLGEAKVEGQDCIGVRVSRNGYRDILLYFEKSTGLLRKMVTRAFNPLTAKEVTLERLLLDYKEFDGVKIATKEIVSEGGRRILDLQVSEVRFPEKVDPGLFAQPGGSQ